MKNTRLAVLTAFLLGLSILIFSSPGHAVVAIDGQFEGTLVVTSPDGEIDLIEPGDPLPSIMNDSIVEVFDGSFKLTTAAGDRVTVSCLEHEGLIEGAASITLACGESSGLLSVESGQLTLVDANGKSMVLNAGDSYEIKMPDFLAEDLPATASGGELGLTAEDSALDVEPDSRNIQISDNQTQSVSP